MRRIWSGWKEDGAVMPGEVQYPGVEIGIEPVGILDSGPQVVYHNGPCDPAKVPEGVLDTADEVLRGLTEDWFAVTLAGAGEGYAKDMGAASLAVLDYHPCAGAEVYLNLLARLRRHAAEGKRPGMRQVCG